MSTTVARATRRRRLSAATAALTALVLAGAAWLHDGVPQADLDLNDGLRHHPVEPAHILHNEEIGRASCRERV